MQTETWKRGDRVYLKHVPELSGTVYQQDQEGIVTVTLDVCCETVYSCAADLEWFTRRAPAARPDMNHLGSILDISWESPAFHMGYLAFFEFAERIRIERITINGVTSLQEAQAAA